MAATGSETALGEYLGLLRRRWGLILLVVLVCVLLAVLALYLLPAKYESNTSVLVQPTAVDTSVANERTISSVNLDTEAQIVTSSVVARQSAELMDSSEPPRELASHVSVSVPANTSILKISFTGSSPATAQAGAAAFAQAYLENRKAVAEDAAEARAASLQSGIEDIDRKLRDVTEELEAAQLDSARTDYLETQRSLLVQQLRVKTAERGILTDTEVTPGSVITEADEPRGPSTIGPALVLGSSLFLGLLLGVIAASLRDRSDRRIRSRKHLEDYGLDVLASRFTLPAPDHLNEESFQQCRNALLAGLAGHRGSFIVTSASADLSGSTVATGLAATLARSGVRTALVCCDPRSHAIEEAFGVHDGVTLTDVLRYETPGSDALQPVESMPYLSVVLPGRDAVLLSGLLQDASRNRVLADFESLAEVVVFDVSSPIATADAQTVVTATQGALLVTTAGLTTSDEVAEVLAQMTSVNAHLLGAVLVDPGSRRKRSARSRRGKKGRRPDRVDRQSAAGASASRVGVPPGHDRRGSENSAGSSARK